MFTKRECRSIEPLLWEYGAGKLGPDTSDRSNWSDASDRFRVEAHLAHCAACRETAEAYRKAACLVKHEREAVVPESRATWESLRARLEAENRQTAIVRRIRPALRAAPIATLAAAALTAFLVYPLLPAPGGDPNDTIRIEKVDHDSFAGPVAGTPLVVGGPSKRPAPQNSDASADITERAATAAPNLSLAGYKPHHRSGHRRGSYPYAYARSGPDSPAASVVQYAFQQDPVDGLPIGSQRYRDFVITPAVFPGGEALMRDYVMGSITNSRGGPVTPLTGSGELPVSEEALLW